MGTENDRNRINWEVCNESADANIPIEQIGKGSVWDEIVRAFARLNFDRHALYGKLTDPAHERAMNQLRIEGMFDTGQNRLSFKGAELAVRRAHELGLVESNVEAFANPSKEIAALVELALSPPLMGMGGGSTTEERAIERWKAKGAAETSRLRIAHGPPSKAPELHRFLDLASEIFGYRQDG